ncbi:unnamed protein product [Ixodes persulcatus]
MQVVSTLRSLHSCFNGVELFFFLSSNVFCFISVRFPDDFSHTCCCLKHDSHDAVFASDFTFATSLVHHKKPEEHCGARPRCCEFASKTPYGSGLKPDSHGAVLAAVPDVAAATSGTAASPRLFLPHERRRNCVIASKIVPCK